MPCFSPWSPIQPLTAGTSAAPTAIVRDSEWTIVSVIGAGSPTQYRVGTPSNSQINDLLEVYVSPNTANTGLGLQTNSSAEGIYTVGGGSC